jgi:hypothetical protein
MTCPHCNEVTSCGNPACEPTAPPKPCRHPNAQTLFGNGRCELWTKADTGEIEHDGVDAWCPDCGALAYWSASGSRRKWKKPTRLKGK